MKRISLLVTLCLLLGISPNSPAQSPIPDSLATVSRMSPVQPEVAQPGLAPYEASVSPSQVDTLVNKNGYRQIQIENQLLRKQNGRLLEKSARFWGLLILGAIASLAQAASR